MRMLLLMLMVLTSAVSLVAVSLRTLNHVIAVQLLHSLWQHVSNPMRIGHHFRSILYTISAGAAHAAYPPHAC
jgi:hypothetical protein